MPRASQNKQISNDNRSTSKRPEDIKSIDLGNDRRRSAEQSSLEPLVNWKFFQSLAMPGENASYSLIDGSGTFLDNTAGSENVWGYTSNQLRDKNIFDLIQEKTEIKAWLGNLTQEPTEDTFRATLPRKNKPAVELNLKSTPLFISTEPSESKIVVKAIIHEDYPSKQLFPHSYTLSSIHDKNGKFVSANQYWEDSTGYKIEDFKNKSLQSLTIKKDQTKADAFISKTVEDQIPQTTVLRVESASKKTQSILATTKFDDHENKISLNAKNITIQSSSIPAELLKVSVELISDSVIVLSKSGQNFRISYVNKAFEELTQYTGNSVIGGKINFLNGLKTNAHASLSIENALSEEIEHAVDILFYRKDKNTFWSKTQLYPITDENGNTNHFIAILQDATEAKKAALDLHDKNNELQSALNDLKETQKAVIQQENLRALGQMASGIAHDFNNLLAPILGFSELLLTIPADSRDEAKLIAYLQKIQVAAQDGASVVGRLREFYRSQSNKDEFSEINPHDLSLQVRELTRHRWKNQAEARGVSIQLLDSCESKRCIRGNESELRQVLTNLVINAVDAMDENGTISINIEDVADTVRIKVSDTGHGMSEEVKSKCLDPFYTTKGKLGTGLGLSIVMGVIQRHGGQFNVDSQQGKGTDITISLPAHAPERKVEQEAEHTQIKNQSLKILLVDDEEVLLEVISELLGSGGHVVDNFAEPKSALEQFKSHEYDLVITDRAMPGMSGDQLAAEMKKAKPHVPIFMVTGFGDLIKETGEMPANIDEVLGKPLPLDVLNLKLAELLNKKA
ncbi:PAS domain-containing protein [Puniceicoccaceae bacterium K14]|nr:PAS domain-containing protein [Puniceicoccaceae bacterium K14]